MTSNLHRTRATRALPGDIPRDLTLVELTWREGEIENWVRFGRPVCGRYLDRQTRLLGFAPGSIFAFVRWASNAYGTVVSRLDIVSAIGPGVAFQTLPFVTPGGELLLHIHGWPKVERVLQCIDAVEALAIDPADVSPDYWRHLHNRLSVSQEPHPYTRLQHNAWLKRRKVLS